MRDFFKEITQDKTVTLVYFINGFFIISSVVLVLFFYRRFPPLIPIFNQLPWGEQRLGTTITIFIPIFVSLSILVSNIFISALIYKNIPLAARMLAAISLLIGILTLLLVVKTIALTA
ncbi:MAG: hypothetical protein HY425_00665 [Candidatus Levybacteria bacterium]|nr:hypothetical protein [Candidatus Levybacteria bacterium]